MKQSGIYKKNELNLLQIFEEILTKNKNKKIGAILSFLGITREIGKEDKKVSKIEMQSYQIHANNVIKQICDEVKEKYSIELLYLYHFIGEFAIGEPIVFVISGGRHRDETIKAIQEVIIRYKKEPALWKKEVYIDGTHEWLSGA